MSAASIARCSADRLIRERLEVAQFLGAAADSRRSSPCAGSTGSSQSGRTARAPCACSRECGPTACDPRRRDAGSAPSTTRCAGRCRRRGPTGRRWGASRSSASSPSRACATSLPPRASVTPGLRPASTTRCWLPLSSRDFGAAVGRTVAQQTVQQERIEEADLFGVDADRQERIQIEATHFDIFDARRGQAPPADAHSSRMLRFGRIVP